mgnify:CR=1 FL=1
MKLPTRDSNNKILPPLPFSLNCGGAVVFPDQGSLFGELPSSLATPLDLLDLLDFKRFLPKPTDFASHLLASLQTYSETTMQKIKQELQEVPSKCFPRGFGTSEAVIQI